MLLRRCAWHPLYTGRPKFLGIVSWRFPLLGIAWSDGCCRACARRFTAALTGAAGPPPPAMSPDPQRPRPA
jgi:hypothetical protein